MVVSHVGILAPQPEMEPTPLTWKVKSSSGTTREVLPHFLI